jgi:predicted nucleic acid-binding protein
MSAKLAFLDTNVVVYAFDDTAPEKRRRAQQLLRGSTWCCSWQVIQEFTHTALHRFATPLSPADLSDYVDIVLWPRCRVLPTHDLLRAALTVHRATGYRWYDSLIVAGAIASGATLLYTEDLQHDRMIDGVRIMNPFR